VPILQIRDMPQDLYQQVALAAKTEHRSMAQQAIVELKRALGTDLDDRRHALCARLLRSDRSFPVLQPMPEDLIREDRNR